MNFRTALRLLATAETLFSRSPKRALPIPRTTPITEVTRSPLRGPKCVTPQTRINRAWKLVCSVALLRTAAPAPAPAAAGYLVHFTVDRPDTVSLAPRSGDRLVGLSGGMVGSWDQGFTLTAKLLDRDNVLATYFSKLFCLNLVSKHSFIMSKHEIIGAPAQCFFPDDLLRGP